MIIFWSSSEIGAPMAFTILLTVAVHPFSSWKG